MVPFLVGYSVLELTETAAGAFCARLLGDLGADVLKVEPPQGDEARYSGGFLRDLPDREASAAFLFRNTNKRSMTLDLATPTGVEILLSLAERADVVIEDLAPGMLPSRGLDYSALRGRNESLVLVSLTPYGQSGPKRDWKARPLTTHHASGCSYAMSSGTEPGQAERPPVAAGGIAGEYEAAVIAATACVAALFDSSSSGCRVDVSKHEALLNLADGCASWGSPFVGGTFRCADGWIECALVEQHQWSALMDLLGNPLWAETPELATQEERLAAAGDVNELLAGELRLWSVDDLYRRGQLLGCPLAPVLAPPDILSSAQLRARNFLVPVEHPVAGRLLHASLPLVASFDEDKPDAPAPGLGSGTASTLAALGFEDAEIDRLIATGVV